MAFFAGDEAYNDADSSIMQLFLDVSVCILISTKNSCQDADKRIIELCISSSVMLENAYQNRIDIVMPAAIVCSASSYDESCLAA